MHPLLETKAALLAGMVLISWLGKMIAIDADNGAVKEFMRTNASGHAGIAESVASSALRQALNKQDDTLGPWGARQRPLGRCPGSICRQGPVPPFRKCSHAPREAMHTLQPRCSLWRLGGLEEGVGQTLRSPVTV